MDISETASRISLSVLGFLLFEYSDLPRFKRLDLAGRITSTSPFSSMVNRSPLFRFIRSRICLGIDSCPLLDNFIFDMITDSHILTVSKNIINFKYLPKRSPNYDIFDIRRSRFDILNLIIESYRPFSPDNRPHFRSFLIILV
jgi:hypothetical protein